MPSYSVLNNTGRHRIKFGQLSFLVGMVIRVVEFSSGVYKFFKKFRNSMTQLKLIRGYFQKSNFSLAGVTVPSHGLDFVINYGMHIVDVRSCF